jgi:NAD-dependent SIR2 family protein deacetylase
MAMGYQREEAVAASAKPDLLSAVAVVRRWLDNAGRVLICAGAGLSAAAGYDDRDARKFAELHPALHRRGLHAAYQLVGLSLPPPLLWGYWASHVVDVRFSSGPHQLYRQLRDLVGDRDHFVITSNADALFTRNGFDESRVFTPQGDFGRYQCERPCTRDTWPSKPVVDALLAAYDAQAGEVIDPAVIPACPRCGGQVFFNVRKGPEFIIDPYLPGGRRLRQWLDKATVGKRLLVLDIGTGRDTPSVVRWPAERLAAACGDAHLVRVSAGPITIPAGLADRACGVPGDIGQLVRALTASGAPSLEGVGGR